MPSTRPTSSSSATSRAPHAHPRGFAACALGSALAVAALSTAVAHWARLGLVDDAYISLRYAQHWVHGQGLVYNLGERVEGFSNFLYVALEALLIDAGVSPERAAWLPSAGAQLALAPLFAHVLFRAGVTTRWQVWLLATLAALDPSLLAWSRAGLEAPLFALAVTAACALALRTPADTRSVAMCTAVALLAAALRPEGVLVIALSLLTIAHTRRARSAALYAGLTAAICVAVGYGVRRAYYGFWLPNTYYAKLDGGNLDVTARGAVYLGQALISRLPSLLLALATLWLSRPGAPGSLRWMRGVLAWLAVLAAAVVWEGGDYLALHRFLTPLLPLLYLAALGPWLSTAARCGERSRTARLTFAGSVLAILLGWIIIGVVPWPQRSQWSAFCADLQRDRLLRAAGDALRARAPADASIGAIAIGGIGYGSKRTIVDALGLVDAHVAHAAQRLGRGLAGHEKFDIDYFFARQPDAIVLPPAPVSLKLPRSWIATVVGGGALDALKRDPRLDRDYALRYIPVGAHYFLHTFVRRDQLARWQNRSSSIRPTSAPKPWAD